MAVLQTYVLPVLAAVLAGGLIGLEREHRGHPAGLRTHMLVALAASLLMLAAVHQMQWFGSGTPPDLIQIDPVRMAHGILTGIGFLCGGVIFRQGLSVHGLTTAASLWTTSALGTLYGVGAYGIALGGTVATLVVLMALRWVDAHLPQGSVVGLKVSYRRDGDFPEDAFHDLLHDLGLTASAISHRLDSARDTIDLSATLRTRGEVPTGKLAQRLCADSRVAGFDIERRDD